MPASPFQCNGSENQRVHFLTERYAKLSDDAGGWDAGPNTLELRLVGGELTINGFPHPDVSRLLAGALED